MKRQTSSRSVLLLMEIIIAILFFSAISAICLQLFVKSHTLSQDASTLDRAVNQCTSVAEMIRSQDNGLHKLKDYYKDLKEQQDTVKIYFDEDFTACRESDAFYYIDITVSSVDGRTSSFQILAADVKTDRPVYQLELTTYKQATR